MAKADRKGGKGMAGSTGGKGEPKKVIATNRRARHDYEILDTLECGMVLVGSEVKSLREAHVQFKDANGWIRDGELWLAGLHIPAYSHSAMHSTHDPDRRRKLLAHHGEILRWKSRVDQEKLTMVPLSIYFLNGKAKVELALAKGRKRHDKRHAIAAAEAERETRRAIGRAIKYGDAR